MALVWQRTPTSGRIKAGSGQRLGRVTVTVAAESEPQGRLTAGEGRLTGGQGATVGWHFQHWHGRKERPMERERQIHTLRLHTDTHRHTDTRVDGWTPASQCDPSTNEPMSM